MKPTYKLASRLFFLPLLLMVQSAFAQAPFTCTTNNGTITITGYDGPPGPVVIPMNINGFPVTGIGENAFGGGEFSPDTAITSVTIPDSVTTIGEDAFVFCSELTTLYLGKGVTNFGDAAFGYCRLTNVVIPEGATILGGDMFSYCSLLGSITIPSSVTNIPNAVFQACGLTNAPLPYGVTSIGAYAFQYDPLPNVFIPSSVTSIGDFAYSGCDSLTNVIVASGVPSVGYATFWGCPVLTNLLFRGNAPAVEGDPYDGPVFGDTTNVTVYYLPGTTGWSNTYQGVPAVEWNPAIVPTGMHNGQFGLTVTGNTNIPIQLQACTNLTCPVWTPLTNASLTNGSFYYSEPMQANASARFYRLAFP
jgi:hypothetical protein